MKNPTQPKLRPVQKGQLNVQLRTRFQPYKGVDDWRETFISATLETDKTALLLCDVWDKHWCDGATERLNAMIPRMNRLAGSLRNRGVQIVHAPSDTLDFYEDAPQRQRAALAPPVEPPEPLDLTDPPLPIDDSDGGCELDQKPYKAWHRQHAGIEIAEMDALSDNGREVYSLFAQLGIDTMLIMGVHTNMCVLGRSFSIRQMTRWGMKVALVRDLTDSMYNPAMRPFVSHDEGTELVIQHIEKYWCPTVLSEELIK